MFGVESLHEFQEKAAAASAPADSRVFLNVSTGGGKTLALMWPVVRDALVSQTTRKFSLSFCFVPLLALQSDLVRRLRESLWAVLHVLSLSVPEDSKIFDSILGNMVVWSKSVLVFLNPERFAEFKPRLLIEAAPPVSTILFDEAHTYAEWDSFRPGSDSFAGIARDFPGVRLLAATATLTTSQLDAFSAQLGIQSSCWNMVIEISPRRNQFYHVVEERLLQRHARDLFAVDRLPCLVVVNSLAELVSLHPKIVSWSGLEKSSVLVFAAGFSEMHKNLADAVFRDASDRKKVMIVMSSYSLGIDAFIKSVVHFGVPRDLASYLQGVGRAGRDLSISEAHCTLVVDRAGLQAASPEMRRFLGSARQKPNRPKDSNAMALCSFCLTWRHLAKDAPKAKDSWVCEQAGAVCANVSRLPCCWEVMALRFWRREQGDLDLPVKDTEQKCGRCDWCSPPAPLSVPPVASFVEVISARNDFFGMIGQVIKVSDDGVKVTVNFGHVHTKVEFTYDLVRVCPNVVLPPSMPDPSHTHKPKILKQKLKAALEERVWGIPLDAVLTDSGLSLLLQWRPTKPEAVRSVCGYAIDEAAVDLVANTILDHQNAYKEKGAPKKKSKKQAGEDRIEEESESADLLEVRST